MSIKKIKINDIFFYMKKHITIFIKNIIYSEKLTYYPESPRKSKINIFFDNFIWLLRFHYANGNYYILGFDRKNNSHYKQKYISGRKCSKFIERKENQISKDSKNYIIVTHDKFVASQYMESLGFPIPRTIAIINNNRILLPKSGEEFPLEYLVTEKKALFKDCICKPVADCAGRGVFHMEIKEDDISLNHKKIEQDKLHDLFSGSKYILQERVIQHEEMSKLNPHSVNTIRLVTCIGKQKIQPFSAGVRIGIKGNITDNWHTGGILIRLNMETGCLDRYGFTLPEHKGRKYEKHPETNVKFDGYKIPYCHQAIEMATKLHKYFYCAHSIGWDIAITKEGPVIIEANQGWDPYVHLVLEDNFMDKFLKYFG